LLKNEPFIFLQAYYLYSLIKVLALREKFDHMSAVSGYDALYQHFPADFAVDSVFGNFKKIYPRGIGRLLATASKFTSTSGFYNAQSFAAESKLLSRSLKKQYDIIHYTYGEPYFGLAGILKKKAKPAIVITNHQPVSWWQAHESLFKKYSNVNKVITLTEYDNAYFSTHIQGKSICIPHGVDTDFYKPLTSAENSLARPFKIIFTGRYLRDMSTLAKVIKKLSATSPDFHFDVVYLQKKDVHEPYLIEIMSLPNVIWHSDLTEHELLSLYQQAACCLLPLEDCTANNALLEAMACGLPVVSTDLPAIKTYLDDSMSILGRRGNAEDLCEALILLYNDEAKTKAMGIGSRNKAIKYFDWNIIAGQTAALFKTICA